MISAPYAVAVVLDREYGPRLRDLLKLGPVWVVNSPINRAAAKELWREKPGGNHLEGISSFDAPKSHPLEQLFIDEIDTIDLHHGHYSADPPYTILRVIGVHLTAEIRAKLRGFGFDSFEETEAGFHASRPLSAAYAE